MKKLFALLVFGFGIQLSLYAQPSFQLDSGSGTYTNNESFCITINTQDFTDILVMQYTITWDPDAISFSTIQNFEINGLGDANFDITNVQDGFISLDWEEPTGEGETLDDGSPIFDICFVTGEDCGSTSTVAINEASVFITRPNASTRNIGLDFGNMTQAEINVAGVPVTLSAEQLIPCPEEFFTVAVTADFFERVESFQYTMEWDTDVVTFVSINPSIDFPSIGPQSFNIMSADQGLLGVSWFQQGQINGVTVPPGTVIYEIVFQVNGASNEVTPIEFSGALVPIEIATAAEGVSPCAELNDGRARVCSEDGDITAKTSTEVADVGTQVCVDVTLDAKGIQAVDDLQFTISWDTDILRFDSIRNMNLNGLDIDDFNLAPTANGALILQWTHEDGVGIPEETRIFEICFTAIGPGGSTSQVAFEEFPVSPFASTTLSGDDDAGLNIRSGSVFIRPPESLNLSVSNATPSPGENICVDILADDFMEIIRLQTSMSWETNLIEFTGIDNIAVPGMTLDDFVTTDAASGVLVLRWESATFSGETITDGERLFSLCFNVLSDAPLGECAPIFFTDIPVNLEAFSTNSNSLPLNVTAQGNELCIFNPEGLSVSVTDGLSVDPDSTICVPVTVQNFEDLTSIQFSVNWNPTNFQLEYLMDTGAFPDAAVYDTTQASLGIVTVRWDASATSGASLADGTPIFDLCLKAVGDRLSCTRIDITSVPLPLEAFSTAEEGVNISLNPLHGVVCINDALFIEEAILNGPTCAANSDGSIEIVASGGSGEYNMFWNSEPAQFTPIASNLAAGDYCVTITDGTGLSAEACYTLEAANPTPVANAGMDSNISCEGNTVNLNGTASSVGEDITYRWTFIEEVNESASVFTATQQSAFAFVISGDTLDFELVVTDTNTGCSATDTVRITRREDPFIDAGPDLSINCQVDQVTLDASNSEQGPNITFLWTTVDGEFLSPDSTTTLTPEVVGGGTYVLRLEHSGGCIVMDTVVVEDIRNTISLTADAGRNQLFNCDTQSLTLGDSTTTVSQNVIYRWETVDGLIGAGDTARFAEALRAGTYTLLVTDIETACVARDTVVISPNENTPTIAQGAIDFLSCRTDSVALNISIGNTSEFSVMWSRVGGPALPEDLATQTNPKVTEAGTYEVIVTDLATGCPQILTDVVVMEDYTTPVAEAGNTAVLGCAPDAEVILSVVGSTEGGVTYRWRDSQNNDLPENASGILVGAGSETPTIIAAGVYVLDVTLNSTGCLAQDSVEVVLTDDLPEIVLSEYGEIACNGGEVMIDATASSDPNGTFFWTLLETDAEGVTVNGSNTNTVSIDGPGLFRVRMTDAEGCLAEQEFEVTQRDSTELMIAIDYTTQEITCDNPSAVVTVTADWSGANPNFSYRYIPRDNGPALPETAEVTLTEAGIYDLEVTETNSMCTRTDLVVMQSNLAVTEATLATDMYELKCDGTAIVPEIVDTQLEPSEMAVWTNEANNEIPGLTPDITEVGQFTLTITNSDNGCTSEAAITIESASDVEAIIEPAEILTCTNAQVTLNAFGSTTGDNITYSWDGPSFFAGQDTETPIVDAAGTYILTVLDTETLCNNTAEVIVEENTAEPAIDVAESVDLGCETTVQVGGAGTASGDNISYDWTDASGASIGSNVQVEVTSAGEYTLVVTDGNNGCTATASILVTQNVDLEDASVGADQSLCDPTATLSANLPDGSTGVWTALNSGMILTTSEPNTMVDEMQGGENIFVWTLSSADCPNYSADSTRIFVESAPVANNDVATLDLTTDNTVSIRVIANDNLSATPNWIVSLNEQPTVGTLDSFANGEVQYSVASLFASVEDQFSYTICNTNCIDLCDNGLVRILVEVDPSARTATYNAITPNGDGKNDELVFDILTVDTEKYPNNELIIFNRWGDIVYTQENYDNSWGGRSQSGQDLPEGTYYFILRLNLGDGEILRGDVTIIR